MEHGFSGLGKVFKLFPYRKLIVYAELYGFPGRIDPIKETSEIWCASH